MRTRISVALAFAVALFVAFAFAPTHRGQGFKKMAMEVAYVQDGAPVQIDSVTHGVDFLLGKAEIKNVSERTVRSVTFGVLLHETAPNKDVPILASSREIQTDIKPGTARTLDVFDLSLADAQRKAAQLKSNSVIVEFGVLAVKLEDGSTWSIDAEKAGTFGTVHGSSPQALTTGCRPTVSSGLVAVLDAIMPSISVVLAQGFFCAASTNKTVCTNNVSSCTNRVCTHQEVLDGTCPMQICMLQ